MDELELFPRTNIVKPLLLLDGHSSRLEIPFLHYINNPKDHWVVSFGTPMKLPCGRLGTPKKRMVPLTLQSIVQRMKCWKE